MSMSPSNILAKLEELRKWQEKQQERLLEQHNKRLEQNNFTAAERDFLQKSLDVDVNSECSVNRPVTPPKVSKQSAQKKIMEGCNEQVTVNNTTKPKQPFLRRGAGLARFRMTPGEQFKPSTKVGGTNRNTSARKAPTKSETNENKTSEATKLAITPLKTSEATKLAITPLKKPNLNVKPKATWHTALQSENQPPLFNITSETENFELTPLKLQKSNTNKCQELTEPNLNVSDKELLIFEALEQRAVQSSFCSTNSSIVRLLSSTPHKNTPLKTYRDKRNDNNANIFREHSVQQIYGNGKQFEAVYARQQTGDEDIMQVRYAQYDQNKQASVVPEFIDDILEDNAKTIEKNAQQLQEIDNYEKKLQNEYLDLIEKAIKFKQFVARDDLVLYTSSSSVTSEDLEPDSTLQAKTNFNDDKKWSDVETCESSSSSTNTSKIFEHQELKRDAETMTDNFTRDSPTAAKNQGSFKNEFEELERELKTIRTENAKVSKLKDQLDQQQREFEKHKKEIVKQVEDEKVRINFMLEEERKKLAKEKMVFERYVKDSQNKPSKKERDEIAALKSEVAALRETLKLKETKNGMAQARLRNQIKSLEKENASLKTEVEKLNRQNGKLVASQKLSRKPSDTKMLHEINKNLTKLTQEQLGKRLIAMEKERPSSEEEDFEFNKKSKQENTNLYSNRSKTSLYEKPRHPSQLEEKENDKNVTNNGERSASNLNTLEETYDRTFGSSYEVASRLSNINLNENKKNDRTERILSDGTRQIEYNNGNVKTASADGNLIVFKYYNGDVKETNLLEGTVRYHYHESKVNHTTNADGTELIEFPDGQTERRLKDCCEVQYPNGIIRRTRSGGTEEICYPDGTTVTVNMQGERILLLPNGQKEIHTNEHKRREYPDGTVKILYPDGLQETRYANGRVRLKDKHGKLLMDSQNPDMLDV